MGATTVAENALVRRGSWIICPLLGALLGYLARPVSAWVSGLRWAPFQGVFELVAMAADPWGTILAVLIGAAIGSGFAGMLAQERLVVVIGEDSLQLRRGRATVTHPRGDVGAVFTEGERLVVLDSHGAELTSQRSALDRTALRKALLRHGFPWHDKDPFAAEYTRWVADSSDLGPRANTLLAARQESLRRRNRKQAALLRTELASLGILVRDSGKHQYWRPVPVT